jgi:hypothetical protein
MQARRVAARAAHAGRRCLGPALAVAGLATAAPAAAAPRVVDLDGLSGERVEVVAGVRLADAGAVLAATVERRGGGARAALVRLRHDGTVVESFGRAGVATVGPRGGAVVAVAAGAQGRRVVVAVRVRGATRLIGVDGRGRRRAGFGRRGVVMLGAAEPVALAARGARLAVASGSALSTLDAGSGRTLAQRTAAGCATPRTAVLSEDGRLIVSGDAGGTTGCRASIAVYDAATLQPAGVAPVEGTRALVLGLAAERDVCVAEQVGDRVRTRRVDPAQLLDGDPFAGAPALAAPGLLTSLAPDPGGGCNLLLARPATGGRIVQADRGGAPAIATELPRSFRPAVVFVCRSHVLTAGVRRARGGLVGALAVVRRHRHG